MTRARDLANFADGTIGDVSGNLTGNVTGNINGLTPQASNMQPFNRIINGAMTIDQRNAGASITPANTYTVDRWQGTVGGATGKYSLQQNAGSVTPPVGFTNYLGATSLSAYSVTASDNYMIRQLIEGYSVSDLAYGTASAATVTVSFWVRSSLTGDFGIVLVWGGSTANQRSYPILYTITSANTWEYKTIVIPGDTTMAAGGFETTNSTGFQLRIGIGGGADSAGPSGAWATSNYQTVTGATSVVGTNGATFYITGVQLEAGSSGSSFAHEFVGDTLQKCQRYYQKSLNQDVAAGTAADIGGIHVLSWSDGNASGISWQTVMRAAPTVTFYPTNSTSAGYVNAFGTDRVASASYPSQRGFSFILVTDGSATNYVRFQYIATAEL